LHHCGNACKHWALGVAKVSGENEGQTRYTPLELVLAVLQNSVAKIGMFSYLTARLNESLGWLADTEKWRVSAGNGVVDKIRRCRTERRTAYFNRTAYVTASSFVRARVIASMQAKYAGDAAVPPS
jgi:hypothetical protein